MATKAKKIQKKIIKIVNKSSKNKKPVEAVKKRIQREVKNKHPNFKKDQILQMD